MAASFDARNRNPQWTYDASGHLLSMNEPQEFSLQPYGAPRHTYDAAGRHASMTQTFTRYDTYSLATTVSTTTQTYDGDGEQVRSLQHRTVNGTQAGTSPQTTYYLRSSVLGGKTITEYDGGGVRQTSYSYLGGEVLSLRTQNSQGTASRYWQHINPVTGDAVTTAAGGGRSAATRLEPAGVNVGERDPLADAGSGGGGVGGGDAPPLSEGIGLRPIETGWGGGGSGGQGLRCHLDGIETGCGSVSRLMDIGAAAQCPDNDCGARFNPGRDGAGRGGWEQLYLGPDGFFYEGIGPSTRPAGMQRPTLRMPGESGGNGWGSGNGGQRGRRGGPSLGLSGDLEGGGGSGNSLIPVSPSMYIGFSGPQNTSPLEFLFTGAQGRYLDAVKDAFGDIALDDNCAAAFKRHNLLTPFEIARKGLLVGGSGLLADSANNKMLGISENKRKEFFGLLSDGIIYYGAPAITIVSSVARPSIILGPNSFNGSSELSLKGVLVHELIHAAGVKGDGSNHDLDHFNGYKDILKNCPK